MKDLTNDSGGDFSFATHQEVKNMIGNTPFNPDFKQHLDAAMTLQHNN
jgi:hypothetical protein